MNGVRIAKMRVKAFRGIGDDVEFDFTSPLTLVFAANGTGKTTMCEAAEWLLTGQVERLRDKGHFDQSVLLPKFPQSDHAPMVDADLHLHGEPNRLQRVVVGAETQARLSDDAGILGPVVGLSDLLGRLAPSAAAEDAHHLRAISLRQGWLRGTRFLSAEALATLVDSDDNTIERRKDVFADLLGIRHLLEAEKLSERYIAEIRSQERSLTQTIERRDEEIVRLTVELESAPRSAMTSAEVELANAERRLNLATDSDAKPSLAARIEAIDVERRRRHHVLVTRREAIETSAARWPERAKLNETCRALEAAHPVLAKKLADTLEEGQAAGAAVAAATAHCDGLKADLRALDAARSKLAPLASELYSALSDLPEDIPLAGTTTIAQLLTQLPQANQDADTIAQLQAEVSAALGEQRDSEGVNQRIGFLKDQLAVARSQAPSEETLARFRDEADRLDVEAQRAGAIHEATAGPLARLQTAGRELVEHQHINGATACPLCSHDWETTDALRNAVHATLAVVPEVERLAQQAAAASSEAARLARGRLEEAHSQHVQLERLRDELASLERHEEVRKSKLARLGVADLNGATGLERLVRVLHAASVLSGLLRESDRVMTTLRAFDAPLLGDSATLDTLVADIDGPIRERAVFVRDALMDAEDALAEQIEKRDFLRRDHAIATEAVRANRDAYARQQGELEKLRQIWQSAALHAEWTEASLSAAREWASGEHRLLEDIAARTVAAQAAWTTEARRTRLAELQKELEPLRARLEYIHKRIAAARDASSSFHDSYVNLSGRQIDDLARVVNPLFARMHANRVFDRIKLGEVDNPLRWLADAGGQELNPGKDFSQGQRQDLALALFLARARSLGGTFFLDEPVTHLDDLNRVGLLDVFRAMVLENSMSLNLVVTTASKPLARHLIEKFGRVRPVETPVGLVPPLRVIELDGNGRTGVRMQTVY